MVHPQPTAPSVPQQIPYYMATYSFPSFIPYQTILLPSYQESQTIQQTLIDKTTQSHPPQQGEILKAVEQKLPDGRPFPREFQKERYYSKANVIGSYVLDPASGYYYEASSRFYFSSTQQIV